MEIRPKLTVAIPIFNEEKNIPALFERLMPVLEKMAISFEALFVDDGSRDRSMELLKQMADRYPVRVRVIELSRNFGQHPALLAAFRHAKGDFVVTLDADLQNPPEEIPKLVAKLVEGYDVVGGVRENRQDTFFRKLASKLVNRITVFITKMHLQDYGCMLRGYSRDVVDQINKCEENSTFIPALGLLFARHPIEIPVAHAARSAGESKYSLFRLIRLNFDLMTGFSTVPLQIFTLFGFATSAGGLLFGGYLLARRFVFLRQSEAEGVFTLFALLFVVVGVLMAGLGIVGEYIGRIYHEVRGRPRYSIRHIHSRSENKKPRIVVFAYSELGHACLAQLIHAQENVVAVYTHEDNAQEKIWFSSVAELARENNIPVYLDIDFEDEMELERLRSFSPDLMFSFYYRDLIPLSILKIPRLGAYNMHGSLLPKYRGRAPINWAVINGETETGATLHAMTEKADAGDIVDQERVDIAPDDTAAQVQRKVTAAALLILGRQIEDLKVGKAPRRAQDSSQATYFGRRRPDDGEIDWSWSARQIHNLIRAVTRPYPGAFGDIKGERYTIWKSRLIDGALPRETNGLTVMCGDGQYLELQEFQKQNVSQGERV